MIQHNAQFVHISIIHRSEGLIATNKSHKIQNVYSIA